MQLTPFTLFYRMRLGGSIIIEAQSGPGKVVNPAKAGVQE
jgi:hypothetical protein